MVDAIHTAPYGVCLRKVNKLWRCIKRGQQRTTTAAAATATTTTTTTTSLRLLRMHVGSNRCPYSILRSFYGYCYYYYYSVRITCLLSTRS